MQQPQRTYGPYRSVVQANNMFFVSGQVGIDPTTNIAPNDVTGQTRQAIENIKQQLASVGLGLENVVSTTVYMTDVLSFEQMNAEYATHFGATAPARATVGVAALPQVAGNTNLCIEISAMAVQP